MKELLKYFDANWKRVFDFFGMELPQFKVKIKFTDSGTWSSNETKEIGYCINNHRYDFGCLIHEMTHFAQHYEADIYKANYAISEGIADYARIKLANDGVWDDPDEPNQPQTKSWDCSRSIGEFLKYLESRFSDHSLIVDLNAALKSGINSDKFFLNRYKRNQNVLWTEFIS